MALSLPQSGSFSRLPQQALFFAPPSDLTP